MSSELLFIDYSVEGASEHCVTLNILHIPYNSPQGKIGTAVYSLQLTHRPHKHHVATHYTRGKQPNSASDICLFLLDILTLYPHPLSLLRVVRENQGWEIALWFFEQMAGFL